MEEPLSHTLAIDSIADVQIPALFPPVVQPSVSSQSTLQTAEPIENTSLNRPSLAKPVGHFMYPIIQVFCGMEKLAQLELKNCDTETSHSLNRLIAIDREKIEKLKQVAMDQASRKSWSVFETVTQYVSSCASIVLGSSLFAAAPVAASLLIASGGLALLNRAIIDSGAWEWLVSRFTASIELQRTISSTTDTSLFSISTILGMAGAIGTYYSGALTHLTETGRDVVFNKTSQIISLAGCALESVTRLAMAHLDQKINHVKADLQILDHKITLIQQGIRQSTDQLKKIVQLSEQIDEMSRQIIKSY